MYPVYSVNDVTSLYPAPSSPHGRGKIDWRVAISAVLKWGSDLRSDHEVSCFFIDRHKMIKGVRNADLAKQPPEREFHKAAEPKPLEGGTVGHVNKGGLFETTLLKKSM